MKGFLQVPSKGGVRFRVPSGFLEGVFSNWVISANYNRVVVTLNPKPYMLKGLYIPLYISLSLSLKKRSDMTCIIGVQSLEPPRRSDSKAIR